MSAISSFRTTLSEFPTPTSASEDPAAFLDAARKHVLSQLRLIGEEGMVASFVETNLFWLAYTYAHAKLCSSDPSVLDNLGTAIAKWSKDDGLTQLINYQSTRRTLSDYLQKCDADCASAEDLKRLTEIDMTIVAAQILVVLRDPERKALFLAQRNTQAQALLDLLQTLLDSFRSDTRLCRPLVQALVKLSKTAGLYPESLFLQDAQRVGDNAVVGGMFGDVWHGKLKEEMVAIKIMRIFERSEVVKYFKAFSHEAVLWHQLRHSNLLPFYGVCHCDVDRSRICLVSPWMVNGNVSQYLKKYPTADRVSLLYDVACGLEYLHSHEPCVIHGDLKGANILITDSGQACIADFGLSKIVTDLTKPSTTVGAGTLRYQAPEMFDASEGRTPAVDIYAFACVCYEMFVGSPPFHELKDFQVMMAVTRGKRPHRPAPFVAGGLDNDTWDIISQCWAPDRLQRPPAHVVVKSLSLRGKPVDPVAGTITNQDLTNTTPDRDVRNKSGPLKIYTPAPGLSNSVKTIMSPLFEQNFIQANSPLEADVVFSQNTSTDSENTFVIERVDKCANYKAQFTLELRFLPSVFEAIAHFNYSLCSRFDGEEPLKGQITMELYRLTGFRAPVTASKITLTDGGVQIEEDTDAVYGIAIYNHSQYDLFPYLFYFDPSTYEIDPWYTPRHQTIPPLPSAKNGKPGLLTLGYGDDWGGHAFTFFVPDDRASDTGYLKLIALSKYKDLDGIEQPCPFKLRNERAGRIRSLPEKPIEEVGGDLIVPITVTRRNAN